MNKLQNLLFRVYAVGCMLVPHSCENKAISAPSKAWAWAELGNITVFHLSYYVIGSDLSSSFCSVFPLVFPFSGSKAGPVLDILVGFLSWALGHLIIVESLNLHLTRLFSSILLTRALAISLTVLSTHPH